MNVEMSATAKNELNPGVKIALDLGPVFLFFLINKFFGIFYATGALMASSAVTLAVYWSATRRLPVAPLVTAGFVLVFGALTFLFHDENFIKVKLTIIYGLLGSALMMGLWLNRLLLPAMIEPALRLDEAGWRRLSWRLAFFFFLLADLNEVVRSHVDTDAWVSFKTFGVPLLVAIFIGLQIPLVRRHALEDAHPSEKDEK